LNPIAFPPPIAFFFKHILSFTQLDQRSPRAG